MSGATLDASEMNALFGVLGPDPVSLHDVALEVPNVVKNPGLTFSREGAGQIMALHAGCQKSEIYENCKFKASLFGVEQP